MARLALGTGYRFYLFFSRSEIPSDLSSTSHSTTPTPVGHSERIQHSYSLSAVPILYVPQSVESDNSDTRRTLDLSHPVDSGNLPPLYTSDSNQLVGRVITKQWYNRYRSFILVAQLQVVIPTHDMYILLFFLVSQYSFISFYMFRFQFVSDTWIVFHYKGLRFCSRK